MSGQVSQTATYPRKRRVLWVAAAASVCVLAAYLLAPVSARKAPHVLDGDLTFQSEIVDYRLPPGGVLDQVLVRPGEVVDQGRALFVLDTAALAQSERALRAKERVADILVACLRHSGRPAASGTSQHLAPDVAKALSACQEASRASTAEVLALQRKLYQFARERRAMDKTLSMALDRPGSATVGQRSRIALSLARGRLDRRTAQVRDQLALLRAAQAQIRQDALTQSLADRENLQRQIVAVRTLQNAPRIAADHTGLIVSTFPKAATQEYSGAAVVRQRVVHAQVDSARVFVPRDLAPLVYAGAQLHISFPDHLELVGLTANVGAVTGEEGGNLVVSLIVSSNDEARLATSMATDAKAVKVPLHVKLPVVGGPETESFAALASLAQRFGDLRDASIRRLFDLAPKSPDTASIATVDAQRSDRGL